MYSETHIHIFNGFPAGSVVEKNAGDTGSSSMLGRSLVVGNGNPAQYSCLENSMDRELGRLQSMGSQKSLTWLSDGACVHTFNIIYDSL